TPPLSLSPPPMRHLRLLLALALPLTAIATRAAEPPPATRAAEPHAPALAPAPAITAGTLPNGLRYLIRANTEPRQRASLRLVVHAGSFEETETQRGLAHFLEHLAFNGSTHYPPGTLIEFFQRMGMNFGGHTNAYTSFDRTVYMLELPNTSDATLAEGLRVFGDYAGGLLLLDAEIEDERGVILSEKLARDSADYRAMIAGLDFLLGQTRVARRLPIGTEDVIKTATRPDFADYYDTWYRPDNITLVAVGDFDPAAFEQRLRAPDSPLATLAPRAPARPRPDLGPIAAPGTLQVAHHHEAEATATTVTIETIVPQGPIPDTAATRLAQLPRELATAMLNRRLEILAKAEDAPFTRGRAGIHESFDLYRNAAIELTTTAARWSDALTLAENELRRALDHGFTDAELREAAANLRNALQQAVATAPTRRSPDLATELVAAVTNDTVPTTPEADLALYGPALDTLTPADCHAALVAGFAAPQFHVSVVGNALLGADPAATITAAYDAARALPVKAPDATADDTFAYTDFGPAGTVATREHIADLDLTLVTFKNGVRLNLKKTDFEADTIHLRARVGTGQLTEPADQPGLAWFSGLTFTAGGLGRHSADDLARVLAGRNVGLGFRAAEDALVFNAATTPADLTLQLQLLAAHLTDPGYRDEAQRTARKAIDQFYNRLETTPSGPLQMEVPQLLAGGDQRFALPTRDEAEARNLDQVRAWLAPQLATGPIELALVGDLDPDTTIAAVAATLGTLPPRAPKPPLTEARTVSAPAEPIVATLPVQTTIPKGVVACYWPTTDAMDVHLARRVGLLAEIFADRLRLKVREEIGGAYSPDAGSLMSDTYPGYGWLLTNITVDPGRAPEIEAAVLAIAADLHDHGVTADELERARRPILNSLEESARTNSYWIGAVLASAQEQPQRLDWARSRPTDFATVTKAELDALAQKYLSPDRAFRFTIVPAQPE
ncbi:MAG: insulinase family protein, partial [Verrucomicrobiota bacterium]